MWVRSVTCWARVALGQPEEGVPAGVGCAARVCSKALWEGQGVQLGPRDNRDDLRLGAGPLAPVRTLTWFAERPAGLRWRCLAESSSGHFLTV